MNKQLKQSLVFVLAASMLFFISCSKDNSATSTDSVLALSASSLQAVAVAAGSSGDSVYVVNTCSRGSVLHAVTAASLPAAINTYLSANYDGYTFQQAFSADSAGTVKGYVVIIQYNNKPVGLKFDASGNFVSVLEQREGHDLNDHNGWHRGGIFDARGDGLKDTVALKSLPAAVLQYFATNYPQDTLLKAYRGRDSSLVVLSTNNGLYATVFTASNTFSKRVPLPPHEGRPAAITLSQLPAAAQSYLSSNYPNYVFNQAFAVNQGGTLKGYVAVIDANNTRYAVAFDAQGNFVKAVTIR